MRFLRYFDLESMCLNVIVSNINLFISATTVPEMYIDFLQRAYSEQLYEMLKRKSLIQEHHMEWLLSPYWKHVTLRNSYSLSRIVSRLQVVGTNILSLNLHNSLASDSMLNAIICCVPNVTSLNLSATRCSDGILTLIRRMCNSLNTLELTDCINVTDDGMLNLCCFNNRIVGYDSLKKLNVIQTRVTKRGICFILKHLLSIQQLKHENLSIILYKLHRTDLDICCKLTQYNLTHFVHYYSNNISLTNVLEVWTARCPNITNIFIEGIITKYEIQLCSKFTQLREMKVLHQCEFILTTKSLISPFLVSKGAMLVELYLIHMTVSVELLARTCRNLKCIFFHNMIYEDFDADSLNKSLLKFNNMETLVIKHLDFSIAATLKSVCQLIDLSSNLEKLCLQYATNVTEKVADIIYDSVYGLTLVDFSFTDMKPSSLLKFFCCETIQKLYIDSCIYISTEDNSDLLKLVNPNKCGATCSWQIDYSDIEVDEFSNVYPQG